MGQEKLMPVYTTVDLLDTVPIIDGQLIYVKNGPTYVDIEGSRSLISGIPIVTTYTPEGGVDGVDYAADVSGVTELYNGLTIMLIPHRGSASINCTLNINQLGSHLLQRYRSNGTLTQSGGLSSN